MEDESKLSKVMAWNVGIYFIVCIIEVAIINLQLGKSGGGYTSLLFMLYSAFSLGGQAFINLMLFLYLFDSNKDLAYSFLASIFLILLIGFPVCFVGWLGAL